MYELIINGRTVYTAKNKNDEQLGSMFDFYMANKSLMNIKEILVINVEEEFCFEG